MEIVPSASTRDACSLPVANWDTTPQENTRNSVAPDSACEGRCKRGGEEEPGQPGEQPSRGESCDVAAAAGTGSLTVRRGPAG